MINTHVPYYTINTLVKKHPTFFQENVSKSMVAPTQNTVIFQFGKIYPLPKPAVDPHSMQAERHNQRDGLLSVGSCNRAME